MISWPYSSITNILYGATSNLIKKLSAWPVLTSQRAIDLSPEAE